MPLPFAQWLSGAFVTHLDVLVERPVGDSTVMQSLRDFGGHYWIRSLRVQRASVDQPIGSGTLVLFREIDGVSLAPLMTASALNQDGGVYAPALDFGREIEIRTADIPTDITVTAAAPAAQGATTIAVAPLARAMGAGSRILFPSGAHALLTAAGAAAAAALTVAPLNRAVRPGSVGAASIEPVDADWELYFQGITDDIDWPGNTGDIRVPFRDRSGPLTDSVVRDEKEYGDRDTPPDAAEVMQHLLDDVMGAGQYVLDDLVSGARFAVTGYRVRDINVFQAVQNLALQWGGKALRQAKNAVAGEFRLAVIETPRDKVMPDYSIPASTYIDVHQLSTGGKNLRTIVRGYATDRETGAELVHQIPAEAAISSDPLVQTYGARYLGFSEDAASAIDTAAELGEMVAGAYADVSVPAYPMEIETKFAAFARVDDLVTWGANDRLWSEDHDAAIVALVDDFPAPGVARTRWRCAPRPKGHVAAWLRRGVDVAGINARSAPGSRSTGFDSWREYEDRDDSITYTGEVGGDVEEVWVAVKTYQHPFPVDPIATMASLTRPVSFDPLRVVVPKPAQGSNGKTYVRAETRYVDPATGSLVVGDVRGATVYPASAEPPIIDPDDHESATVGTLWFQVVERGMPATAVEVMTQVGALTAAATWGAPARTQGAASVVKGGLLAARQYEHDVALDASRLSWISVRVKAGGRWYYPLPPFAFDRNKVPTIISIAVDGTKIAAQGDAGDTRSWRFFHKDGTWEATADGMSATVDVAAVGTNGVSGIPDPGRWNIGIEALAAPAASVTAETPRATADRVVATAGAPAADSEWSQPPVAVAPAVGASSLTLRLLASAAPAGYTVRVFASKAIDDEAADEPVDVTALLSPALAAPPTVLSTYALPTPYQRVTPTGSQFQILHTVSYTLKCEIRDGGGTVVDVEMAGVGWSYSQ